MNINDYQDFKLKFERFENLLKSKIKCSDNTNFYNVLLEVSQINNYIKKNFHLILDLNSLRNVYSHRERGKYIAKIEKFVFSKLDKLIKDLSQPKTVSIKFHQKVETCTINDLISSVMKTMDENTFTHIPVWNGNVLVGVFSYTSLFIWLSKKIKTNNKDK